MNDTEWEPDEEFKVQLVDEITQKRLEGENTECVVTILDDDKPGSIGFPERFKTIQKGSKDAFIVIKRFDGSAGNISCIVNTINDHDVVPGKRTAAAYKDFVPIKMKKIEFGPNEVEYKLKIEMPNKDVDEEVDLGVDDTVSFAVQLSEPYPKGVKLSKRSTLFVDIENRDE